MSTRWNFNHKLVLGLALVLALLLANALVSFRNIRHLIENNQRVTQTHAVLAELQGALSTMQDAETGQRGYVITGQESYLEPYNVAETHISGRMQRLRQLAEASSVRSLVPVLERQVQTQLDSLQNTIALRRTRGREAALQRVVAGEGKRQMDAIRATVAAMQSQENAFLVRSEAQLRAAERGTLLAFGLSSLASLALLGLVCYFFGRDALHRQRAAADFKASNARFGAIISSTSQIVWTRDKNGDFVEKQPLWSEFTGQNFEQIQGIGWLQAVHPDDRERVKHLWQKAVQSGALLEIEYRLRRHDGRFRDMVVRAAPVRDEKGAIREWVGTSADVSERKSAAAELHQSEARKAAILETALDCIIAIDHQSHITEWNPAAEKTFGHARADVLGATLPEIIIPVALRESHYKGLQHYLATGEGAVLGRRIEVPALHADGHEFPVELAITRIKGEGPPMFSAYLRDISERKEAEATLRETEERYRLVARATNDAIWDWDFASDHIRWNEAVTTLFGYAPEEVGTSGSWWKTHIHPDDRERVVASIYAVIEGQNQNWTDEYRFARADGSYGDVLDRGTVIRDAEGRAIRMLGAMQDLTERKRAEADLALHARLATLTADVGLALTRSDSMREVLRSCAGAVVQHLDAAFARIWTLDELENVLELQASAGMDTHLVGFHSRVPVGQFNIGRIASERVPHLTNEVVGDARVGDQEWARREGMVAFAGYPLLVEGRLVGVMAMFARQALPESVLRALATVADAIALGVKRKRAEEDLERARAAAEEASRTKSLFLANMSHELRTPLNAILGYSEMLFEEAGEQQLDGFSSDLDKINGAGKHLLALINDILDLSKIEAGKMELYLEEFDVAQLLQEVATTTKPLVAKNTNTLHVETAGDLGTMRGDEIKVRQCLLNLLSNAAKFTKEGHISLEVRRERMESMDNAATRDWMVFRVADTGIGLSAEQILGLFQAFSQADASTTRKFGGTGLGLALTRRFCQMMGGDVTVQSVADEGSIFTIKIPAKIEDAHDENSGFGFDDAVSGAAAVFIENGVLPPPETCVLVIDDDATQRDLMRRFLQKEGFAAQTASSGEEGLRLAHQLRPIAITLDVMMPGIDGWSVLTALKADAGLRDIPVIMLTMVDDKNRGFALGAADYATKPVDRARLSQILKKYVCAHPPCPVLLVEDDAATREIMRAMLEKEGWAVSEAANGREALERIKDNRPHLILLDLMMPEMDGFEFAATLHRHDEWRAIPIVVLTAKDLTDEDRLRLNGYVQKILQKAGKSREELLRQVRDLVAACAVPKLPAICAAEEQA